MTQFLSFSWNLSKYWKLRWRKIRQKSSKTNANFQVKQAVLARNVVDIWLSFKRPRINSSWPQTSKNVSKLGKAWKNFAKIHFETNFGKIFQASTHFWKCTASQEELIRGLLNESQMSTTKLKKTDSKNLRGIFFLASKIFWAFCFLILESFCQKLSKIKKQSGVTMGVKKNRNILPLPP